MAGIPGIGLIVGRQAVRRSAVFMLVVAGTIASMNRSGLRAAEPGGPGQNSAYEHLQRGEALAGAHQYNQAIDEYEQAIQLKPNFAEAYNDRGFAYYLKGNVERAIADYTRAIELRPNYPKAFNSRGVVYMAHGYGAAKAVADFDRAIALKPDFQYAYINRANARLFRHPGLALDDFHRAAMHPERKAGVALFVMIATGAGAFAVRRHRVLAALKPPDRKR